MRLPYRSTTVCPSVRNYSGLLERDGDQWVADSDGGDRKRRVRYDLGLAHRSDELGVCLDRLGLERLDCDGGDVNPLVLRLEGRRGAELRSKSGKIATGIKDEIRTAATATATRLARERRILNCMMKDDGVPTLPRDEERRERVW